ncbi:MAG: hypothetical protein Q9191_003594 [Dirinaria sp. TL-2023a]
MVSITRESLDYIVNHVVLPPRLPSKAEPESAALCAERDLLQLIHSSAQEFIQHTSPEAAVTWESVERMLAQWLLLSADDTLVVDTFLQTLSSLSSGDSLALVIKAQNAALVIRKTASGAVFECFELSPYTSAVLACKGALRRQFPAHAVSVPDQIFTNHLFQLELGEQLRKLASEKVKEMMPVAIKAEAETPEVRDTVHPRLVTEMLMATLGAVGEPIRVRQIEKRTRDESLWHKTLLPWRRSPQWLALRVTIQLLLTQTLSAEQARREYKNFVLFLLTNIMELATSLSLPREILFTVQAKISRRAYKLRTHIFSPIEKRALELAQEFSFAQGQLWNKIQDADASYGNTVDICRIEEDTHIALTSSNFYLDRVLKVKSGRGGAPIHFSPKCPRLMILRPDGLPDSSVFSLKGDDRVFAFQQFESWVRDNLWHWVMESKKAPTDEHCANIASLCYEYKQSVLGKGGVPGVYHEAPEQTSTAILTIGELWRALDILAVALIPLLGEYSPELSEELFCPLLLPKETDMGRLMGIERHISWRKAIAKRENPSVLTSPQFAAELFESSQEHQILRTRIEADAERLTNRKKEEWQTKQESFEELRSQAAALKCNDEKGSHNASECEKCRLEKDTGSIQIEFMEWPLPKSENECRAAVVELRCPTALATWRNVTWMIVKDLAQVYEASSYRPRDTVLTYDGLQAYRTHCESRITLASDMKSHTKTHYLTTKFPVKVTEVFRENPLVYQYYDTFNNIWTSSQKGIRSFLPRCITSLPEGPYKNLQYAVYSTNHSQNRTLAEQSLCSEEMTLQEYKAFGSLRADGEQTQWLNIKRELGAPNLSLNSEAVVTVIVQAAWQVGSSSDTIYRRSHQPLQSASFCNDLLSTIRTIIDTAEGNWTSQQTLSLLVALVLRVVSLTKNRKVFDIGVSLLQRCRTITSTWIDNLSKILRQTVDPRRAQEVRSKLLKVALLAKMTYDLDIMQMDALLQLSDVQCWVRASMVIHDNVPGSIAALPQGLQRLLLKDQKLSSTICGKLRKLIIDSNGFGLVQAITKVWPKFEPHSEPWTSLPAPNGRWVTTKTSAALEQGSQFVSYNLLQGKLLVNGKPLGHLPKRMYDTDLFRRIFGSQVFSVCASNMPGMQYMSAQNVQGYEVHFGRRDHQVIIRLKTPHHIMEAIPSEYFDGDFPQDFVNRHIHWLDLSARTVEFRPSERPLCPNASNWQLQYDSAGRSVCIRGAQKLVDIRSSTSQSVFQILGPIEALPHMHITSSTKGSVEVYLPRLRLHFFTNRSGELECLELRKIVDPNQSIGTLIGLKSKLVLCSPGEFGREHDRLLLVPQGSISCCKSSTHHVEIQISYPFESVRFFTYQIDSQLGRLRGHSIMLSRLYLAYLHATTSYICADPLTGRTGTEQALDMLQTELVYSSSPLDEEVAEMLRQLANLTPKREFYPVHLEVMEDVSWNRILPHYCQHDDFATHCAAIQTASDRFNLFYPDCARIPPLKVRGSSHLLLRAQIRRSAFRRPQFGGNIDIVANDMNYESRDRLPLSDRGKRSFNMGCLIRKWPARIEVSKRVINNLRAWGEVSGFGSKFQTSASLAELLNIDFKTSWAKLHRFCIDCTQAEHEHTMLFLFATIAYGDALTSLVDLQTLCAFAINPELRDIDLHFGPGVFEFPLRSAPEQEHLKAQIMASSKSFRSSSHGLSITQRKDQSTENQRTLTDRANDITNHLMQQWPCREPQLPTAELTGLFDLSQMSDRVLSAFNQWWQNRKLETALRSAQGILNSIHVAKRVAAPKNWLQVQKVSIAHEACSLPTLESMLSATAPSQWIIPSQLHATRPASTPLRNNHLRNVLSKFKKIPDPASANTIRRQYIQDLVASYNSYWTYQELADAMELPYNTEEIAQSLGENTNCFRLAHFYSCHPLRHSLNLLEMGGLAPRATQVDLLRLLSSSNDRFISDDWIERLVGLAEMITYCQRDRRLLLAAEKNDYSTFWAEIENTGRSSWDPKKWRDWLLIEVENDLLIRHTQAIVALEMIQPAARSNTLTQLNMGEGKSSVIVPLIATALADSTQLSRVLVLKSLSKQMKDLLSARIGSLVRRQVYYMPFSRKTSVTKELLLQLQILQEECVTNRGVLLTQPEFLLSFKLKGLERMSAGDHAIATRLFDIQQWLNVTARDLLDESDEILDVKFQLIYTLGSQRSVDGQPERWLLIQSILGLVAKHAEALAYSHSELIQVQKRTGLSFPTIQMLVPDVGDMLLKKLLEDLERSKIPGINLEKYTNDDRKAIIAFMEHMDVAQIDCQRVERITQGDPAMIKKFLLFRGLFAYGILLFILQRKRWLVNYGHHPDRCLIAVPYRAKGVPAGTADFGHPDVTITLTCLSYYYRGLTDVQLRQCFEILSKTDNPSQEYRSWTQNCASLPLFLRIWECINLDDEDQCINTLFPALRYIKKVADFFMAKVVFPREGREFDQKLSTSGWDIPFDPAGPSSTTGFSGTNDNRFLLPSSITQRDLTELQHTSAKVLDYVLKPQNLRYECAKDQDGRQLDAEALLDFITSTDSKARVLIDVGAQVLEMGNEEVMKKWITRVPEADAGIFFDTDDNIKVLTREGWTVEAFNSSSYQTRMDSCLVYLDEVHTRGIDLKLPTDARAFVTLGPRLTKDRLVQACMRLRRLAHGQTLLFVAPPEVHNDMLKVTGKGKDAMLNGEDVMTWALEQSCLNIERNQPLQIMQGLAFYRRQQVAEEYSAGNTTATSFIETELQSLHHLYAPTSMTDSDSSTMSLLKVSAQSTNPAVQALVQKWKVLGLTAAQNANVEEEQEREIAHEKEQEKENERPSSADALKPIFDERLKHFITSGSAESLGRFELAVNAIARRSSAAHLIMPSHGLWNDIRVTRGFMYTVKLPVSAAHDDHLRPVNWILTSKTDINSQGMLVLSQYEVNVMMDEIRQTSSQVVLHSYEPRVARSMHSMESAIAANLQSNRDWLRLRPALRRQLHFFAGQLYFDSDAEYREALEDLSQATWVLPFMREWMAIRRHGQNFMQSHVGQMLSGQVLDEDAFDG